MKERGAGHFLYSYEQVQYAMLTIRQKFELECFAHYKY